MRQSPPSLFLFVISIFAAALSAPALAYEQVWIPLTISARTIKLEASLYRPEGAGPFPVLLYSHGSTGNGRIPENLTLRPDAVARYFVDRGFVVLAPMRRGRGASEGKSGEVVSCDSSRLWRGIGEAVEDTDAAIAYLRSLPYADASRIVLSGSSRGGFLSVIYVSQRPGVARGVVNFAGGWTGDWGCNSGFNPQSYQEAGARTLREAGERAAPPMLWLYAQNDSYYQPHSIRSYAAAYEQGKRSNVLRLYPALAAGDGHYLSRYPGIWQKDLDEFLDQAGFAKP